MNTFIIYAFGGILARLYDIDLIQWCFRNNWWCTPGLDGLEVWTFVILKNYSAIQFYFCWCVGILAWPSFGKASAVRQISIIKASRMHWYKQEFVFISITARQLGSPKHHPFTTVVGREHFWWCTMFHFHQKEPCIFTTYLQFHLISPKDPVSNFFLLLFFFFKKLNPVQIQLHKLTLL